MSDIGRDDPGLSIGPTKLELILGWESGRSAPLPVLLPSDEACTRQRLSNTMYRRLSITFQDVVTKKRAEEGGSVEPKRRQLYVGSFRATATDAFLYTPSYRNRRSSVTRDGKPCFSTTDTTTDYKNLDQVLSLIRRHLLPKVTRVLEIKSWKQFQRKSHRNGKQRLPTDESTYQQIVQTINENLALSLNEHIRPQGYEVIAVTTSEKARFFRSTKHVLLLQVYQVILMPTTSFYESSRSLSSKKEMPFIDLNGTTTEAKSSPKKLEKPKRHKKKRKKKIDAALTSPRSPLKLGIVKKIPSPSFPTPTSLTASRGTLSFSSSSLNASVKSLPCIPSLDLLSQSSDKESSDLK